VQGTLRLHVPEIHQLSDAGGSVVTIAAPSGFDNFGVFFTPPRYTEYPYNLAKLSYQQFHFTQRAPGVWGQDFNFNSLPLGDYNFAVFEHAGEVDSDYVLLTGPEFSLPAAAPSVAQDWQIEGPVGSGRIFGKLLLDGNAVDTPVAFQLYGGGSELPTYGSPVYNLPLANVHHGRVFYEITGLTLDSPMVGLSWPSDTDPFALIEGQPAQSNTFALSAADPELNVDFRVQQQRTFTQLPQGDELVYVQGYIDATVTVQGATS
jgi:hypothetical protein